MSQKRPNKRPRINRVVRMLSQIYEFNYQLTLRIYNYYNRNLDATKLHLKWFREAANQLDFIDTHNYSF